MAAADFTTSIRVDNTPAEVFGAINDPGGWWSEAIEGSTDKEGEIFHYHFEDMHYTRLKLQELIPDKRVVWQVLDNYFHFTHDKSEWKDTRIIFDIAAEGGQTSMTFTHEGLVPDYECYEVCKNAWTGYITKSLHDLITKGKGAPNGPDKASFDNTAYEQWKANNR
jgi:hypothetical protein